MQRKPWRRVLATFGAGAVFSFVLASAGLAHSTQIYTVPWVACQGVGAGAHAWASCPLTQGSDMPVSALSLVYFDYVQSSGLGYTLTITKESFTGSVYHDSTVYTATSTGATDRALTASNVKTNANVYDYLEADVVQSAGTLNMYGVAEVNSL
ncbi:MAG TPA: hypothetical protein VHL80_16975 [Polyangia bacterium]|nr:hypothetical protein [Polyangia bacterium]